MKKKLRAFTVESTGEVITVPPVSAASIAFQVRNANPEPKPPLVEVVLFGKATMERNSSDPDYLKAFDNWQSLLDIETTQRALRKIARCQKLSEEQKKEVQELREDGEELPKSDKLAWMLNCALGYDDDIQELLKFAQTKADPQEEKVKSNSNGFQSELQPA